MYLYIETIYYLKGILYYSYISSDKNDEDSLPLKKIADNSYIYICQTKKIALVNFLKIIRSYKRKAK